jgi:PhoPQ-activated pathogenicity-related protein
MNKHFKEMLTSTLVAMLAAIMFYVVCIVYKQVVQCNVVNEVKNAVRHDNDSINAKAIAKAIHSSTFSNKVKRELYKLDSLEKRQ